MAKSCDRVLVSTELTSVRFESVTPYDRGEGASAVRQCSHKLLLMLVTLAC